jgi:iron complex transport system substrate-binding protein
VFPSTARPRSRTAPAVALLLSFLLLLAGCGGGAGDAGARATGSEAAGSFQVTVRADNGEVTVAEQPGSIVSMSATATEMLFAIGAGAQVVAVDSTSNHPADAPTTDLSAFTPNAEAIAGYSPTSSSSATTSTGWSTPWTSCASPPCCWGRPTPSTTPTRSCGPSARPPATPTRPRPWFADMRQRIDAAVASVPAQTRGLRVYHELDPAFYSATSGTFTGSIYAAFGLENIADGAGDTAGGYPQLSAEYIVGQAPDLIVLADTKCCAQAPETLAQRPAFDTVPAVQSGRVLAADDDVASRWGPRIVDFAESVAAALRG